MKIKPFHYGFFLLIPFLIVVLGSILFTPWQTSELETISNTETDFNSESIRGWMTFVDVSQATGIPLVELYKQSGIPFDVNPNTPFKDIKLISGLENFETEVVRFVVDNYKFVEEQGYKCPYGIHDDPYPGLCSLYTDENQDGNCDYELG